MITKRLPHVRSNRQPGTLSRRSQPEVRLPYRPDTEVVETAVIAVSCAASTAMRRPLQRDQRMAGSIQQPGAGRADGGGELAVQVVVRAGRSPDAGWRLRRWRAGLSRLS